MQLPRRSFVLASVLALFTLGGPAPASADLAPAPVAETTPPAFAGTFRYAGDAREDAQRHAAIDRGVESLFFAIRPIARWRLAEATRVLPWFSVTFDAGKAHTRGAEGLDFTSPLNGGSVPYQFRGERYRVAQSLRLEPRAVLTQKMIADEGAGQNEWTISADGSTLTCKVTITSSRLPKPIVYNLTYKRS